MIKKEISQEEFMRKIESLKEKSGVDLSTTEDLSIAVMNLISLEEHFFFTAVKTGDDEYFNTAQEVRNLRKEALHTLMPTHEGETWCASKHLLAASMRFMEVGNKLHSEGKKEEAKEMFARAHKTYSIFWALKLRLINVSPRPASTTSGRLENLMAQLADCCNE